MPFFFRAALMDCIQPFPEAKLVKNQSGSTPVLWTFGIDLYPLDGWVMGSVNLKASLIPSRRVQLQNSNCS
jgi:hypothetical protein